METWSVKQLVDHSGMGRSTVQQRATQYAWVLSSSAAPGGNKPRRFTPRDVAIMMTIHMMANEGKSHGDIESEVKAAIEDGAFDDITDFPGAPSGSITLAEHSREIGQLEAMARQAIKERDEATRKMVEAERRVSHLEGEIKQLEAQLAAVKADARRVEDLIAKIARLEVLLEIEHERKTKSS